jgi:hypothetical protein
MLGDPAVCLSALIASYWTWHFPSVVEAGDRTPSPSFLMMVKVSKYDGTRRSHRIKLLA